MNRIASVIWGLTLLCAPATPLAQESGTRSRPPWDQFNADWTTPYHLAGTLIGPGGETPFSFTGKPRERLIKVKSVRSTRAADLADEPGAIRESMHEEGYWVDLFVEGVLLTSLPTAAIVVQRRRVRIEDEGWVRTEETKIVRVMIPLRGGRHRLFKDDDTGYGVMLSEFGPADK